MDRNNFIMIASSPHRNKYQGAAGSLNSVNPNLTVDTLTVLNTLTVNNLVISGSTGIDFTNLAVNLITGNTGVFNDVYVTGTTTVQDVIVINGTLNYTGFITTGFDSLTVSNANFTNMTVNNLTGTNLFITGSGNISNESTTTLNLGTGTFSFANSNNNTSTNFTVTTLTGTNLIVNRLTITGTNPGFFLSTGGSNLDWYATGSFSMTGQGACTGTYNNINYVRMGSIVQVTFPTIVDTVNSNGAAWTMSALPQFIRPFTTVQWLPLTISNSNPSYGTMGVSPDGTIALRSTALGSGFANNATLYGNSICFIAP